MTPHIRLALATGIIGLVIGAAGGLALGWKLYHPEQVVETNKPELRLDDDIIVLQRLPDQPVAPELKKAAKKIDGTLKRTATVKLQPRPKATSPANCECEPIILDIGTVDEGNGLRTVVHTDDATILGGTDNPLEPYRVAKETKWEVGAIVPLENPEGVGPYVSRKVGPFSVGIQIAKPYVEESYTAMATIGIRF